MQQRKMRVTYSADPQGRARAVLIEGITEREAVAVEEVFGNPRDLQRFLPGIRIEPMGGTCEKCEAGHAGQVVPA